MAIFRRYNPKESSGVVPEDFAIYEKSKDLREHDGILYRIRTVRPEQEADIRGSQ